MAGGASSRMKKTVDSIELSKSTKEVAKKAHKSLIPLGTSGKPLLHYLLQNAKGAAYTKVYLITALENQDFKDFLSANTYEGLSVYFAIQHIPEGREKPLGTADAILQAMEQFPELQQSQFTLCNGDNLYSEKALSLLREERTTPNAVMSYSRSGFQFDDEKISKFAAMKLDSEGFLTDIIEKPSPSEIDTYRDASGELRLSMNTFSFEGSFIYPFLKACPMNPARGEKELPQAVLNMIAKHPKSMIGIPISEHLPDLTAAQDIQNFEEF